MGHRGNLPKFRIFIYIHLKIYQKNAQNFSPSTRFRKQYHLKHIKNIKIINRSIFDNSYVCVNTTPGCVHIETTREIECVQCPPLLLHLPYAQLDGFSLHPATHRKKHPTSTDPTWRIFRCEALDPVSLPPKPRNSWEHLRKPPNFVAWEFLGPARPDKNLVAFAATKGFFYACHWEDWCSKLDSI